MYCLALATDYDGTLAHGGVVDLAAVDVLERFKKTGRRLILVTGRELPDVKDAFPRIAIFDRVVAENGALVYNPATEEQCLLGEPPPDTLVARLRERKITPLSVGRSIVATREPNHEAILQAIRDMGLELQIIFNKGAVMVLPSGINKAVGLQEALRQLQLSRHNVVGVGDAENDLAFLRACGCASAVANALPTVKKAADIKLVGANGAGVVELIELISRKDADIIPAERNGISLGGERGREFYLRATGGSILVAGKSGFGKSTLATALTERMAEKHFEFCVFDPEGDYDQLQDAVSLGDAKSPPTTKEVLKLLDQMGANLVVNTQGLNVSERPDFFIKLLPRLAALRAKSGRPHWLLIDEAHHLLPTSRSDLRQVIPDDLPATILITVHPEAVSPTALKKVEVVIAVGEDCAEVIHSFCKTIGIDPPSIEVQPKHNEVLVWVKDSGRPPQVIAATRPQQSRKRHTRKYAEGNLGEDVSFYFRGPRGALNLRANNLMRFVEIAHGVDDLTWMHHLRRGDYSNWFRCAIKDDELAEKAAEVECDKSLDAKKSRQRIEYEIRVRYTASAHADGP